MKNSPALSPLFGAAQDLPLSDLESAPRSPLIRIALLVAGFGLLMLALQSLQESRSPATEPLELPLPMPGGTLMAESIPITSIH